MIMTKAFSGKVIDKGNFYPSTTMTDRLIQFKNYKKGWLIDWGMETFWGMAFGASGPAPSGSYFNISDLPIDTWVAAAKTCNINYAGITAVTEIGYGLWPSDVNLQELNASGLLTPTHAHYNVRGTADPNIIGKFVTKFRSAGIEPFIYHNLSIDWNMLGSFSSVSSYSTTDLRRAKIIYYWCLNIQELMIKYGVKMFWFDAFSRLTNAEYQQIYNAVKAIDTNALVIMNATGNTTFDQFPYDAQSTETAFTDQGNTAYQSTSRTYNGTTYFVPQEIVISGTSTTSPQNWYNYDQYCVSQPQNPNLVLITQSTYQSVYDAAKNYGANLLCAVMPDRHGNLYQPQIDLIKNLT
jgi:hypothetical protein